MADPVAMLDAPQECLSVNMWDINDADWSASQEDYQIAKRCCTAEVAPLKTQWHDSLCDE